MQIPLRESPLPKDIDPSREESKIGQSLALPVLTTSVNWAFPLSEKAYDLTGTKAKVKQIEITKDKKERILMIEVAINFCNGWVNVLPKMFTTDITRERDTKVIFLKPRNNP